MSSQQDFPDEVVALGIISDAASNHLKGHSGPNDGQDFDSEYQPCSFFIRGKLFWQLGKIERARA